MPRSNRFIVIYATVTILLVVFGVIASASIGLPFILLGLVMGALFPLWERPTLYWPVVGVTIGILAGYSLVTPAWCGSSVRVHVEAPGERTVQRERGCTSLGGVDYRGRDAARVRWPAAVAAAGGGALGATAGALGGRAVTRRRAVASA